MRRVFAYYGPPAEPSEPRSSASCRVARPCGQPASGPAWPGSGSYLAVPDSAIAPYVRRPTFDAAGRTARRSPAVPSGSPCNALAAADRTGQENRPPDRIGPNSVFRSAEGFDVTSLGVTPRAARPGPQGPPTPQGRWRGEAGEALGGAGVPLGGLGGAGWAFGERLSRIP